jgi:hypothetical protein
MAKPREFRRTILFRKMGKMWACSLLCSRNQHTSAVKPNKREWPEMRMVRIDNEWKVKKFNPIEYFLSHITSENELTISPHLLLLSVQILSKLRERHMSLLTSLPISILKPSSTLSNSINCSLQSNAKKILIAIFRRFAEEKSVGMAFLCCSPSPMRPCLLHLLLLLLLLLLSFQLISRLPSLPFST